MTSELIVFPFDAFGNEGTAAGAKLLGDAVHEMIDDTRMESMPVRLTGLVDQIAVKEIEFADLKSLAGWRELGAKALRESLKKHDFTLWLGGNHLSCLPVYETLIGKTLIIQFDAHLDCYDLHDTHGTLSNGNFLRELKSNAVINLGHRDQILSIGSIAEHFEHAIPAVDVKLRPDVVTDLLIDLIEDADSVWIDIDADAFDPSFCPAVLNPLPMGLSGFDVLRIVEMVPLSKFRGVSLSEFCPAKDEHDRGLNLLGWLVEWLLLRVHEAG